MPSANKPPKRPLQQANKKPKLPLRTQEPPEPSFNLFGRNAVLEALNHGKQIDRVLVKKGGEGTLRVIAAKAREQRIILQEVEVSKLDTLAGEANHQGVAAICPPQAYADIEDILCIAQERNQQPLIIILDSITDPHNLGAIIRTAEAAGVHGIIIPKRRAVGLTPVVAKVSSGALTHMAIARVSNITSTISELKKHGLWVCAADMTAQQPMYSANLTGALALVIGSEGGGVSRLVKESCDFLVRIPMHGKIGSLNASVAAGVLVYEVLRQREAGF